MNKLEKIEMQERQTREKIAALQTILKQIDGARTEQENLQIVQLIRALKLSRDELYAFLGSGVLPPSLLGAIGGSAAEPDGSRQPETVYSRPDRKRRNEPTTTTAEPEGNAPDGDGIPNFESEGINHEE